MIEETYIWLIKHLIWNGPKQINGTYWIKLSKEDANMLKEKYEVVDTKSYKKEVYDVVRMLDNNIVLKIE